MPSPESLRSPASPPMLTRLFQFFLCVLLAGPFPEKGGTVEEPTHFIFQRSFPKKGFLGIRGS